MSTSSRSGDKTVRRSSSSSSRKGESSSTHHHASSRRPSALPAIPEGSTYDSGFHSHAMVVREHSRRDDASKLAGEMESLTLNASSRHQATWDLALQRSGSHRSATSSSRSTHDHGSTHRSTRSTHDDRSSTHSHRSTHDDRSTHRDSTRSHRDSTRDSTRSHRDSNRGYTSSRDNDSTIRAHDTHRSRTSYGDHQIVPHRPTPHHSTRHRHSLEFDDLDDLDSDDLDDLDLYDGLTCQYDALTNLAARPSRSSRAAYDNAHDEFDRELERFATRWAVRTDAPVPTDYDDVIFFASLWACQSLVDDTRANRRY